MTVAPSSRPRIIKLPPTLVDQIAAGEVVERAASVVKELCENSLDAGARRIDVEIEGGGRSLIRVVDDGCGLSPAEARLALERHATSKISRAEDLWGVETFGFRGEALPSIASVSRLRLGSRPVDADEGFVLRIEAGVETEARAAGMPTGTQIEVRDLFFNTPARLKFQKTESTEAGNVSESLLRLALANPDVHFRLRTNGRVALDLPPHRDLAERVRAALARRGAGVLHEAVGDENGVCVHAFLGGPECASTTARNTFLFVGRRFVRDRSLLQAVCMGYGELLERGRYPLAVLFVDVPGEDLDVNVHPQKLEVRFANPQPVYGAVRHVIGASLARAPFLELESRKAHSLAPGRGGKGALPMAREGSYDGRAAAERSRMSAGSRAADPVDLDRLFHPRSAESPLEAPQQAKAVLPKQAQLPVVSAPPPPSGVAGLASLRYLGTLARTYLLLETEEGGLCLVDQHAAHERVLFQKLRTACEARDVPRQRLLFPIPIELDEARLATVGEAQDTLQTLGFELEAFGLKTALVRAVPELLAHVDPKPMLRDVLDRLAEGEAPTLAPAEFERVLSTLACHSATRAGDVLDPPRVAGLLAELDAVDWRSHCPHGRPVLVRLPLAELERRFGRT